MTYFHGVDLVRLLATFLLCVLPTAAQAPPLLADGAIIVDRPLTRKIMESDIVSRGAAIVFTLRGDFMAWNCQWGELALPHNFLHAAHSSEPAGIAARWNFIFWPDAVSCAARVLTVALSADRRFSIRENENLTVAGEFLTRAIVGKAGRLRGDIDLAELSNPIVLVADLPPPRFVVPPGLTDAAITLGGISTIITSAAGHPLLSSMSLRVAVALSLFGCEEHRLVFNASDSDADEPLLPPWWWHPTMVEFGSTRARYFVGGGGVNTAIAACVILAHLGLCHYRGHRSVLQSMRDLRFPGVSVIGMAPLLSGSVLCGVAALGLSSDAAAVVVSCAGIAFAAGAMLLATLYLTKWFAPAFVGGEWRDRDASGSSSRDSFARRFGVLFAQYEPGAHWAGIVEMVFTFCMCCIAGRHPSRRAGCDADVLAIVALMAVYFTFLAVMRPLAAPKRMCVVYVVALVQLFGAVGLGFSRLFSLHHFVNVGEWSLILCILLLFVFGCCELLRLVLGPLLARYGFTILLPGADHATGRDAPVQGEEAGEEFKIVAGWEAEYSWLEEAKQRLDEVPLGDDARQQEAQRLMNSLAILLDRTSSIAEEPSSAGENQRTGSVTTCRKTTPDFDIERLQVLHRRVVRNSAIARTRRRLKRNESDASSSE